MRKKKNSTFDSTILSLQQVHEFVQANERDYMESYPQLIFDIVVTKTFRWFIALCGIASIYAVWLKTSSMPHSLSQIVAPIFFVLTPGFCRSTKPWVRLLLVNQMSFVWIPVWLFQTYLYFALSLEHAYSIGLVQFTYTMIWMFTFHGKYRVSFTMASILTLAYTLIVGRIHPEYASVNALGTYINYLALGAFLNSVLLGLVKYKFYAAKKRQEVESILECTPQGIFRLYADASGGIMIGGTRSRSFSQIFGMLDEETAIPFDAFLRESDVSAADASRICSLLGACIGEDIFAFELNEASLPQELVIRRDGVKRYLSINWAPMTRAINGIVNGILVSVTDVTEQKIVARENEEIKHRQACLIQLTNAGRDQAVRFAKASQEHLSHARELLEGGLGAGAIERIFIIMHSIKGAALTLGMKSLADVAHDFESDLSRCMMESDAAGDSEWMAESLAIVGASLEHYLSIMTDDLLWMGKDSETMEIEKGDLDFIVEARKDLFYKSLRERPDSLLSKAFEQTFPLVFEVAGRVLGRVGQTAEKLQKPLPFLHIQENGIRLYPDAVDHFETALTHIVNNSMDHGIEGVAERRQAGKNDEGRISIRVGEKAESIVISCSDDGRGLDIAKLRQAAAARGLQVSGWSDQQVADLLLSAGFSTKDKVTQISGRGVGLNVVADSARAAGGQVFLDLSHARGPGHYDFVLAIELPRRRVFLTESTSPFESSAGDSVVSLFIGNAS